MNDTLRKKIALMGVTFLLAVGAYWTFTGSSDPAKVTQTPEAAEAVRKFVTRAPTTRGAAQTIGETTLTFSPGEETRVKIYDEVTGRLKYIFEAQNWEPVNETDFNLRDIAIQIFMPRGETTYITANHAEVTLARKSGTRVDPKRGRVWGDVKIIIDRTTAAWREANPTKARRDDHADDLIHISLPEARFDMDRAELLADGDVRVDGEEVRIENCRGLTVQWDQVDNRIDLLRFEQGGKMMLRRGGRMIDFALPGTSEESADRSATHAPEPSGAAARKPGSAESFAARSFEAPRAQAMKPVSIQAIRAAEAAAEIRLEGGAVSANQPRSIPSADRDAAYQTGQLRSEEQLTAAIDAMQSEAKRASAGSPLQRSVVDAALEKGAPRVQSYRAVFDNQVVVRQIDGEKVIGEIDADRLELNFDFGKKQRRIATGGERKSADEPSGSSVTDSGEGDGKDGRATESRMAPALDAEDLTRITLEWNGPLELRPIAVDASEQSGERFDAIATGAPVRVMSQQGARGKAATARCAQLVYRHERRQVWLSGNVEKPVEIHVVGSGALVGREVFFDQRRGLGRVEGAGRMTDDREEAAAGDAGIFGATAALTQGGAALGAGKAARDARRKDPVMIRWSRGVDLELGIRTLSVVNPTTGLREEKNREFLRRAWFHGNVFMEQEGERLKGEEVAVTFGAPLGTEEVADHITHLSMTGDVRLERGDDVLAGDRLDVEMAISPDQRSLPKVVDAAGGVLAKQDDREIRADRMFVTLTSEPGPPRVAKDGKTTAPGASRPVIETVDARGSVYVHDPAQNLKISRADHLQASMGKGNTLRRADIVAADSRPPARARFGDVALHGARIEIDMDREAIRVPGPGTAFFRTTEDFSGRKLDQPGVVRTTWADRMEFNLARNYGVFLGKIASRSENFSLTCDKLTVRFDRAPPPAPRPARGEPSIAKLLANTRREAAMVECFASPAVVTGFTVGRLIMGAPQGRMLGRATALAGSQRKDDQPLYAATRGERKEPVYLVAEGNAETISSERAPRGGLGLRGRLLYRVRIAAAQIAVDLKAQQMNIPCEGTLLIEDYQFDPRARRSPALASESAPMMSSLRSEGPSQTAVVWSNSMDYFVDRNLVVFDRDVTMVHRSGREMVLRGALTKAMGIDPDQLLRLGKGRVATLRCGNLLLEFKTQRGRSKEDRSAQDTVRATDLERLIARQAVHLKDDTKSLTGEHLQYLADLGEVRLEGGPGFEATIMDEEERSGRFMMWRGPVLIWDRVAGRIEAPRATIRTSQR